MPCVNMHDTFGHYIRAFIHRISRISPWEQQGEGGGKEKRKGGKEKRNGGKERRNGGKEKKKKEEKRRRKGRKRGKERGKGRSVAHLGDPDCKELGIALREVGFPPTQVILRLGAV